jgi:DnaJ-class molecular chaperone
MKKISRTRTCPICKGEGYEYENLCTFCKGKGHYSCFIIEVNPKDIKDIKLFNEPQQ